MLLTIMSAITLMMTDQSNYRASEDYQDLVARMIATTWLYQMLFGIEFLISIVAVYLERVKTHPLRLLFFRRFVDRQLMYFVAT
jgi:hypothetical protein